MGIGRTPTYCGIRRYMARGGEGGPLAAFLRVFVFFSSVVHLHARSSFTRTLESTSCEQRLQHDAVYTCSTYLVPGIIDSEVAVSSNYLVLAGTWYNRTTTPLRHASNASSYHTRSAGLGEGREAGRPSVYGYHNNDAYLVFYCSDL